MNQYAVFHSIESAYSFSLNKNQVILRIRVDKKDNISHCYLLYNVKHKFFLKRKEKELIRKYEDDLYAYYEIKLFLKEYSLAYIFHFVSKGKDYYYSSDGLCENYQFETRCIHGDGGFVEEHPYGAVSVPIFQTATFAHPGIGKSTGYDYSRESNPTRYELESVMSSLEGADDSIACSTGMAAIGICLELFGEGSHILCTEDLYGGTVRMFESIGEKRGLKFSYVDTSDIDLVRKNIRKETKALYIETPSNPTMRITDFAEMRKLADEFGLLILADNTFLSPYFQKPLQLGADIVVHSGTKFLGGHNDVLAGFVCVKGKELSEKLRYTYKTVGCSLSPFDSFLVLRGIKTLSVRLERQQENAKKIALWLKNRPEVTEVYYPGLEDHPGYEVNRKQATGAGSMLSFRVDTVERTRKILESVKLISYAESLGGVESLITYPMLQTHGDVPVEIREHLGITEDFLRMSVGIENAEDLIKDLEQAFQ